MATPVAEEQQDDEMTPEDAKLLGDILQGDVDVNGLSDREVARLSVYVDDLVGALQSELSEDGDGGLPQYNPPSSPEDDAPDSPEGRLAQVLFAAGGEEAGKPLESNMIEPVRSNIDEDKRAGGGYDVPEGDTDQKDEAFYSVSTPSVMTESQYGVVANNAFWLKTKPQNLQSPDAAKLLQALEAYLGPEGNKLLTGNDHQYKVGEDKITVYLDPAVGSNYNASTIATIALKHSGDLANVTDGITVVDAGVGTGSDELSVRAIKQVSNDYIVVTFVLCGAVAGIVLAMIIIYIFRRHLLSREKLQQLGRAGEVEEEASKDYQDLCRQRMQSKASDKPEPVHVAARIGSASDAVPRSTHSSRSSTSSWSEEPAVTNMDISTGHIVLSYMEDHLKNKDRLDEEWEGLVAYEAEPNSVAVAMEPANMRKNRYSDVLPYDHSRVVLNGATNISGSDYVNASTITDHDPRNPAYIATQGPLPHTVADFWQMVWEQGSVVIVNLTKLTEAGNAMCHRYWPEEGSDLYHIYEVHLVSEHIWCDDYLVRSFYLKNLQTNETRTVTQFHFLSWLDLGIPASIKALLDFRRKVNKSYRGRSCPIAVHCSDGSGRSGTYCLIDMVLNRMSKGAKEIDIAATLEHIRDQRMQMVKTKQQFEFALASVAEEVTAILKALPQ